MVLKMLTLDLILEKKLHLAMAILAKVKNNLDV